MFKSTTFLALLAVTAAVNPINVLVCTEAL
jgi:hypothetical protein